ncbi:hypothetical protein FG386_002254 [Cryptosporidium ryanae]|uniref:uncharacterized protein n=1 Tax=Cryptosporidium ryanae TaxID=515981 RepID=UPI00351A4E3A|nr:hypothetical protein FG386_002254 [Cryptosporidium ryanae]
MNRYVIARRELFRLVKTAVHLCIVISTEFALGNYGGDWMGYGGNLDSVRLNNELILTKAPPVTVLGDPSVMLVIPARKVCHKGSFDSEYNSCTYIDKKDEAIPIYEVG